MRILITGGAGFIGSHLAEAYLKQGDEVYVIDDLSTGSLDNLAHLQADEEYAKRLFVHVDTILNHDILLQMIGTCDVVFHMAAAVGVQYILDNPLRSIRINIRGTEQVLDLCAKFKKKVLIASSSEVYGKHLHAPLVETDNIIYGPSSKFRWSYAASKLMDEFTALAHHRENGLEAIVVRFFNTVGPRQTGTYGMVIPRLVSQALAGKDLTVYGDGEQSRTFTYVEDVVKAVMLLVNQPDAAGEVFNIGGVEEISIKDLAYKIVEKCGSSSQVKLIPYEEAFPADFEDMQRRLPSIEKLKNLTGYAPTTDLNAILDKVIEFFRNKK
ncbi:UDP-glucose 4-epimerase [Desulfatibacillum alkenivorans DSM 16219]|jgi:UDP-glucose 4-epimerase|uniref:UDP-glucuronate decarboxylase n=1 Tax=Desulfatibacillum alkenivorans DSM 16219 TaxID=1121393 RepID=A0A1M6SEM6_9BACT|nr:GDP-mannose 4,6-dehydratase [Desulfatibacillum alkenivorans]SHK43212.1 UDP-glucose 4-epimerase [Desulfatibacillum alkenivorans DSM 16219]